MSEEPFIKVRALEQQFGENHVLKGIDLDIYRGETLVLLGASGSGKSVLTKHIIGLLQPKAGTIEIDGVEISKLSERDLGDVRQQLGMMFQNGALFDSLTVGQNIAFPLRERGMKDEAEIAKKVSKALEIVKLSNQEAKMPSDLSGGMKKRVALARAVVERPSCVMYDEPHAGLDPITADSIDHLIKSLEDNMGITNIVITHELRSVFRIASRIAFLKEGQIYWQGSAEELKNTEDKILRDFIEGQSSDGSWV